MGKNIFAFLYCLVLSLILTVCVSCGGGGGGGATLHDSTSNPLHHDGSTGGWGAGTSSNNNGGAGASNGSSGASFSEDKLFSLFPYFDPPVSTVDISISINGASPVVLTGLNSSAPKSVLPEMNIGDIVSGNALIHLSDGSTRNAVLFQTELCIDNHLSFIADYHYRLINPDGVTVNVASGTFTTQSGINVSSYTAAYLGTPNATLLGWKNIATGAMFAMSGIIYPPAGDGTFTAVWDDSDLTTYTYTLYNTHGDISGNTGGYTQVTTNSFLPIAGIDVSNYAASSLGYPDATLIGWKTASGTVYPVGGIITPPAGDIELYTVWDSADTTPQTYTLYNTYGTAITQSGSGNFTTFTGIDVSAYTAAALGAANATLKGWKDAASGVVYTPVNGKLLLPTMNVNLYAYWERFDPVISYKETSSGSASTTVKSVYNFSYLDYGDTGMPVTMKLPVANSTMSGSMSSNPFSNVATCTYNLGESNHSINTNISGAYCESFTYTSNMNVKIKPVDVKIVQSWMTVHFGDEAGSDWTDICGNIYWGIPGSLTNIKNLSSAQYKKNSRQSLTGATTFITLNSTTGQVQFWSKDLYDDDSTSGNENISDIDKTFTLQELRNSYSSSNWSQRSSGSNQATIEIQFSLSE